MMYIQIKSRQTSCMLNIEHRGNIKLATSFSIKQIFITKEQTFLTSICTDVNREHY